MAGGLLHGPRRLLPRGRRIPTLEPSRAGFTQTGWSNPEAIAFQSCSPARQYSTCGILCLASRSLKTSLSMQIAEASTSEPA